MMKHSNSGETTDNVWLADAIAFNKVSVDNEGGDVLPKMRPCLLIHMHLLAIIMRSISYYIK
jgi:hypothetical protein